MRGTVALGHVDPNFDLQLHISSYKENHKTEVLTRAQTHNKRKITLTKISWMNNWHHRGQAQFYGYIEININTGLAPVSGILGTYSGKEH